MTLWTNIRMALATLFAGDLMREQNPQPRILPVPPMNGKVTSGEVPFMDLTAECGDCAKSVPGKCDACGEDIPECLWMGNAGYQSHTVDHWHRVMLDGKQAQKPIFRKLCAYCYDKDFARNYPGEPLPKHQPRIVYD